MAPPQDVRLVNSHHGPHDGGRWASAEATISLPTRAGAPSVTVYATRPPKAPLPRRLRRSRLPAGTTRPFGLINDFYPERTRGVSRWAPALSSVHALPGSWSWSAAAGVRRHPVWRAARVRPAVPGSRR